LHAGDAKSGRYDAALIRGIGNKIDFSVVGSSMDETYLGNGRRKLNVRWKQID
jgi:hypothetical protein